MSDLVRRIRDGIMDGWSYDHPCLDGDLANEAADALEARDKTIAELVAAIDEGVQVSTPELMDWVADRLVLVYHESQNVDYVQSLRSRAKKLRLASSKAQSKDKAE